MNVHVVCGLIHGAHVNVAGFASRPMADAFAISCDEYADKRPRTNPDPVELARELVLWSVNHPAGLEYSGLSGFHVHTIPVKDAQ